MIYQEREGRCLNNKYIDERMYSCHRSGNISNPESTHPEVMTIYRYAWQVEQQSKIKQIYAHPCRLVSGFCFNVLKFIDAERSGK